jgi:dUTPase
MTLPMPILVMNGSPRCLELQKVVHVRLRLQQKESDGASPAYLSNTEPSSTAYAERRVSVSPDLQLQLARGYLTHVFRRSAARQGESTSQMRVQQRTK